MNRTIDLRSDTVTQPTEAMRKAMAEADVGDDVFGEDRTAVRLQERVASTLGFEAAIFMPTGVMSNEVAIRLWTRPGDEVLCDAHSHVVDYELSGMAALSGVMPRPVVTGRGHVTARDVETARRPRSYYRSEVTLLILENTHNLAGGTVTTAADMQASITMAHELGLKVHVDGARLWNAAIALGCDLKELVQGADSAMVTLSKGLCAPVGSILCSNRAAIESARRIRKQLGGGMRQIGHLAAAGLVAVETMVARLAEDHAKAQRLAEITSGARGASVVRPDTNILFVNFDSPVAQRVGDHLQASGVRASVMTESALRFVTHRDVSLAECEFAGSALVEAAGAVIEAL
ncbi:MAG: low specificity L-threonine aldolase [Vicinamibacteria bacterium]|nr:low specificity L-threonine aldolase [Vicinamibacteria bacterium]